MKLRLGCAGQKDIKSLELLLLRLRVTVAPVTAGGSYLTPESLNLPRNTLEPIEYPVSTAQTHQMR